MPTAKEIGTQMFAGFGAPLSSANSAAKNMFAGWDPNQGSGALPGWDPNQGSGPMVPEGWDPTQRHEIVGPGGQRMAQGQMDPATGRLVFPAGVAGYQSPYQRVDTSAPGARLAATGNQLAARGMGGQTVAGLPAVDAQQIGRQTGQIDRTGFGTAMRMQDALGGRGDQAISQLQAAAGGQAPSVAALQQQQGIDAAVNAAMAMGASARGSADARAAAMRQAGQTAATMQQGAVNQAAQLRAAEMAQARNALVGAIGQQQGLAQEAAGLQSNLAQSQAQLNLNRAMANQGAGLQAAGLGQQGYLGGRQLDLDTARLGTDISQAGARLGLQGAEYNNQLINQDFANQFNLMGMDQAAYENARQRRMQREVANSQQVPAMIGAGLNAAGSLAGLAMPFFAPAPVAAAAPPVAQPSYQNYTR